MQNHFKTCSWIISLNLIFRWIYSASISWEKCIPIIYKNSQHCSTVFQTLAVNVPANWITVCNSSQLSGCRSIEWTEICLSTLFSKILLFWHIPCSSMSSLICQKLFTISNLEVSYAVTLLCPVLFMFWVFFVFLGSAVITALCPQKATSGDTAAVSWQITLEHVAAFYFFLYSSA